MEVNEQSIFVVDPIGVTGEDCACGEEAKFLMGVSGHSIHICHNCIAELGKRIIDGLT